MVVAGDNLFSQSLEGFRGVCQGHRRHAGDLRRTRPRSHQEIQQPDPRRRRAASSPSRKNHSIPTGTITGIALYYYAAETVKQFNTYIEEGNNPDQPGRFIQWLYPRLGVHTYPITGTWFDIGSKETLEEANGIFAKFV